MGWLFLRLRMNCCGYGRNRRIAAPFARLVCLAAVTVIACGAEKAETHSPSSGAIRPTRLRCEFSVEPLGVDSAAPRLSWELESGQRDQRSSAYRVLVASSPELLARGQGDLWDSGRVDTSQAMQVVYGGTPLRSRLRCFWKVRVWDRSGRASAWSPAASWEMGLMHAEDWQARWIGNGAAVEPRPASGFFKSTNELAQAGALVQVDGRSTLLRKSFVMDRPLRRARAYVTGLGYYEFWCNGRRVGDRVLAPAKSNYRKWVLYDTYDVTSQLRRGTNAIGMHLGNGWFNPYPKWWEPYRMQWFGSKRAVVQLHLDYADGTSQVVASDESWEAAPGPVLASCVFDGETYDAREARADWSLPAGGGVGWSPANLVESPGGVLVSHLFPPIRVVQELAPVSVKELKPGVFVFDLGQNFSGWVRLRVKGPRGHRVTLRYAEDLAPDDRLDVTSNERARATDIYICGGQGNEVYEPRFTFHGFRYVEVDGLLGAPTLRSLTGCVVHTDAETTGEFACDDALVGRIHRATRWSQRSNLMGYPMDCPQRDERLGWFGDAMVSMEEAMFNFDLALFYRHWLNGVRFNQNETNGDISIISPRPYVPDEPDPTWSTAYPIMVWEYYLQYGDRRFLADHFESMRRYVDYLRTQAVQHILPKYWIGDWGTIVEGWQEGEPLLVATACYYQATTIVAKAARVLGKTVECQRYELLSAQIKRAFNDAFFDSTQKLYEKGTQFSQAFPLFLGLVDPADAPAVMQHILQDLERRGGHFNVGVLGAKYLIEALTRGGHADAAYRLVQQRGYPSWAHMLEDGRTTLSEFWDLHGSHNHVMMGSIDAWFYAVLAGIQRDEDHPGFERVVIKPFVPDSLSWVGAAVRTVRGPLRVEWRKQQDRLRLDIRIPVGIEARVVLPAGARDEVRSQPELPPESGADGATFRVGSGHYRFFVRARK